MAPYDYTSTNTQLIADLGLLRHIEGGFFKETHRYEETMKSPLAPAGDDEPRPIATTIYYLLTAEEPRGYFHRNRSHTMHVHHQGRSQYTLIIPRPETILPWTPIVTNSVMGTDHSKGETRQLMVEGQTWKMSGVPEEDVQYAATTEGGKEKIGCLISEVVAPGFVWQDHEWMTMEHLKELFKDAPDGEAQIAKFSKHIRPADLK